MGSCIPIYIVPENDLRAVRGSKDAALFEQLVSSGSDHLVTPLSDELTTLEILGAMVGRPPLRRALRNILYGLDVSTPSEWFYMNAYELLLQHFSFDYFEDWIQVASAGRWVEEIQAASPSIGLNLDFNQLLFGGGLVDLPEELFYESGIGFWSSEQVKSYKDQVDQYLASEVCESQEDPMQPLNYPIHDVAKWLNRACLEKDGAIVALKF